MINNIEKNRWSINKIGLLNYWFFDEEEFEFGDGRLLLKGPNGIGKSVTMQSFIPLLFDGNKGAERLDSFKSKSRKLEDYVLGYGDNIKEENTSYLYMEFLKKETGNPITIGMGLRGKKGRPLDFWGFCITDGRRIGKDFFLYKNVGEKIPLSKQEFKNTLGLGGSIKETQKEYMQMVNDLIFGFENLTEYEEFLKLIIEVRAPKLSRDFSPTTVMRILSESLQPLSEEDLRPMAEAIENMNKTQDNLESLILSKRALNNITTAFDLYNRFVLLKKASNYIEENNKFKNVKNKYKELEEYIEIEYKKLEELKDEIFKIQIDIENYENKKQEFEKSNDWKIEEKLNSLNTTLEELKANKIQKEDSLNSKNKKAIQLNIEIKNNESGMKSIKNDIERRLDALDYIINEEKFYEHEYSKKEILENLDKKYDYLKLKKDVENYMKKISYGINILKEDKAQNVIFDKTLKEKEEKENQVNKIIRQISKQELEFDQVKEEFIEQVYVWNRNNANLKLKDEELQNLTYEINDFDENNGFSDILSKVTNIYNEYNSFYIRERLNSENVLNKVNIDINLLQEEINEWKDKKEPEPTLSNNQIKNREKLNELNIPFIPFYKIVEFKENIKEENKGLIEEALIDMGILDSLIIPEEYRSKIDTIDTGGSDKYLFSNARQSGENLNEIFDLNIPENINITYFDVEPILNSITLDDKNSLIYLNEKGEYKIGVIKGKASKNAVSKYIGIENRKQFKAEIIKKLEIKLDVLNNELLNIQKEIENILKIEELLIVEYKNFPGKESLEECLNMLLKLKISEIAIKEELQKKEQQFAIEFNRLKEIKEKITETLGGLELSIDLEVYIECYEKLEMYKEEILEIEKEHIELFNKAEKSKDINEQIEYIDIDIYNLQLDTDKLKEQVESITGQIENLKILQNSSSFEDLRKQIEECVRKLKELPEEKTKLIINKTKVEENVKIKKEEVSRLKINLEFYSEKLEIIRDSFIQEKNLNYVYKNETKESNINESAIKENIIKENTINEKELISFANKVIEENVKLKNNNKTLQDYSDKLALEFQKNIQDLSEYNLSLEYIFDKKFEQIENMPDEYKKEILNNKRRDITSFIQGKRVNIFVLSLNIEDLIKEIENLIDEEDRILFEEILANTIVRKIRMKIYHAFDWVNKTSKMMEDMDTSNGINFSIKWRPKAATNEDELDTKNIVELLSKDLDLLKEEEKAKFTNHFRTKMNIAKIRSKEDGNIQSFHNIMKNILDYRNWFEFQYLYKRPNEQRKELTNNAFNKFSGGEKAMAMYVPLFAAVNAKLESARKDTLRIIAMDEAFAGVDDMNIRDMFRILTQLELDYIANSQVLWGDYDTVPKLAISEFIKTESIEIITLLKYEWDGNKRRVKDSQMNE
jgi:uncharacterized protein (TIGR02680 family)